MADTMLTNEDYNRFYLNLLADNALIIRNALSPEEEADEKRAKAMADKLDALAEICVKSATVENNKQAFEAAQEARKWKKFSGFAFSHSRPGKLRTILAILSWKTAKGRSRLGMF